MSLITFPNELGIGFQSATLKLSRKTLLMRSPYTGKSQALANPYALWNFSGKFTQSADYNAGLLRSFLSKLEGQNNKFKMPVPGYAGPLSGYISAAGLVNGAGQTGKTLVTKGWVSNSTIFNNGDYFTVNGELKIVTVRAYSDSSGNCSVQFEPSLRNSPPDAYQLIIGNVINLLAASNKFSDSTNWSLSNCTAVSGITDPIGGSNAWSISKTATGNTYIFQTLLGNFAGKTLTFSGYIKQGNYSDTLAIFVRDQPNVITQIFGGYLLSSSWQYVTATITMPQNSMDGLIFFIDSENDVGSAGDTFQLYNFQLQIGSTATTYKNTLNEPEQIPYAYMASNNDDQASWDLTPPVIHDIQLDAIETF